MTEDLVKEHASRPAGEDRRARKRVDDRRAAKPAEQRHHIARVGHELLFVGKSLRRAGKVATVQRQFHPVIGPGRCLDEKPPRHRAGSDLRPFAVHVGTVVGCDRQRHVALKHEGIVGECRGDPAQPAFPHRGVDRVAHGRTDVGLRILSGKVRCRVLFLNLRCDVRLHTRERLGGLLERAIGRAPERETDRPLFIGEGKRDAGNAWACTAGIATDWMGIVQKVVADADLDGREVAPLFVASLEGAIRRRDVRRSLVVHGVTDEIGRHRFILQHLEVTLQLRLQHREDRAGGRALNRWRRFHRNKTQESRQDEGLETSHDGRIIPTTA